MCTQLRICVQGATPLTVGKAYRYNTNIWTRVIVLVKHYSNVTWASCNLKSLPNNLLGVNIKAISKHRVTGHLWRQSTMTNRFFSDKRLIKSKIFFIITSSSIVTPFVRCGSRHVFEVILDKWYWRVCKLGSTGLNTLRRKQNGHKFADEIIKSISCNPNYCIAI